MIRAILIALALACLPAFPQELRPEPKGTGSISGAVLDSRTKAGVPDARIQLSGLGVGRSTPSDSEGRFLFWDLAPGLYRVTASTPSGSWLLAQKTIRLSDGQDAKVELSAEATGSISGRVVDQDGKPVAGMSITMMRSEYYGGVLGNRAENKTTTEEDGTFLLTDAAPGVAHTLRAERVVPSWLEPISEEPADPAERKPAPETVWYPDVTSGALAQPIVLYSGEERKEIEIRVKRLPARCVEGTAEDTHGPAALDFESPARRGATGEDGRFRICGVPRGEFQVTVRKSGQLMWGSVTIPAGDKDVTGLKIIAAPRLLSTLRGVVELEDGTGSGKLDGTLTIMVATRVGPNAYATGSAYGGMAKSSIPGMFSIPNVDPGGDYQVTVGGLPDGYVLNGKPRRAEIPLRMAGNELRLVVGRWKGGTLGVIPSDAEGNLVLDAWAVAFPASVESEAALSMGMRVCAPGQTGGCQLQLEPGKYLVMATTSPVSTPSNRETIARLWRARSKAKQIEIAAGSALQATLPLTELE